MDNIQLIIAALTGIALLLVLVIRYKLNAFISLLKPSIIVGMVAGMPASTVLKSMQQGIGGTLGFAATVVWLRAISGVF